MHMWFQESIMHSSIIILISLFLIADSSFSFPHFNGINPHPKIENLIEPEGTNWRTLKSNDYVSCDMADILNFGGLEELQAIVEAMAARNGISPFMILKKLNRRMKNKDDIEENMINAIDGSLTPEQFSQSELDVPPVIKISSETNRAPYYMPQNSIQDDSIDKTQVVFIPVSPSRSPIGSRPEHSKPWKDSSNNINNMGPLVGKLSNMLPNVFLPPKSNQLKPLFGATVRVDSGDPLSPLSRDIIVTVSPLMTIIEALRQAENKYQNVLGLDRGSNAISFVHSDTSDCYVVNGVDHVVQTENSGWKVTITDRDGQMVYNNFCLPTGKDNIVKPGTVISLTYVPLVA